MDNYYLNFIYEIASTIFLISMMFVILFGCIMIIDDMFMDGTIVKYIKNKLN